MTDIEILDVSGRNFRCAFYYAVPAGQQMADAVDANRVPAGSRLTAQELQDLKDGKLYELVRTVEVPDTMTTGQIGALLIANRTDMQPLAATEYKAAYSGKSFVGKAYNGASWS